MADPHGNHGGRFSPERFATAVSEFVRSMIVIVLWTVAGVTAIAVGYIALRTVWWAVQQVSQAVGF